MAQVEISIVVPSYNEEGNIAELYTRLKRELGKTDYSNHEIIFVDDGSNDRSWEVIKELSQKDRSVRGFRFSRNFGHQNALKAGLDLSRGQAVISMDGDLQHPPELIHQFLEEWKAGYQIVQALHKGTEDAGPFKELTSRLYYSILNSISDFEIVPGASDFRLLDRAVVDEIKSMNESNLFIRSIISWIGFNKKYIEYHASKRFSGQTKYSFKKMLWIKSSFLSSFCCYPCRFVWACSSLPGAT